ncbi:uncharacterized protein LOC111547751 isoform X1 [Piliocolobus tephrosceles]|uniref:uncharacterized protein LOC111547751 isoform X1 n=1 Tax=Piliocolobus tephrosceles TaxID=591936 RepID=UPI000C2B2577|nr:uncharacterized protein LOC111547751 isoform X1 [Piliocolobus tephrosceles]
MGVFLWPFYRWENRLSAIEQLAQLGAAATRGPPAAGATPCLANVGDPCPLPPCWGPRACGSPASPSGVARTLLGPGSLLTILNSDFPEPLALLRFQGLIPVPQGGFKLLGLEELGGLSPWSPVEGAGDIQMLEAGGREHRLCVLHTELQVCPSHCEPCDLSRRLKPFLHPMRPITPSASEHSRDQDEHGGSCPGTWHTVTGWQDAHLQVWPEGKSVDILV